MLQMGNWKKRIEDNLRKKYITIDPLLEKTHVHKETDFEPSEVCSVCGGWGAVPNGQHGQNELCQECEGTGEVW
jgi:DnaJ-class molecular chaperone